MFNLLRLFRRDDTIDDTAAAYIEGRANEREQAELRDRAVQEPGLFRDLDSIRDTVSLLRSVESVAAPRSFALSVAPVQVRVKRSRMAMAPAAFAIAAAAVVGLLAVGNLADVVHQNDDAFQSVTSRSSAVDSIIADESLAQTESAANAGSAASSGPASVPSAPEIDSDSTSAIERSGTAPATGATPIPGPLPTNVPADASLAPPADPAESVAGGPVVEGALPPVDGGAPDPGFSLVAPGQGGSETEDLSGAEIKAIEPGFEPGSEPGSSEPIPLPESTLTALFDPSSTLALESAEPRDNTVTQDEKSGFSLPLWQLQTVFASIAVLMAGAWMILQRRLTA